MNQRHWIEVIGLSWVGLLVAWLPIAPVAATAAPTPIAQVVNPDALRDLLEGARVAAQAGRYAEAAARLREALALDLEPVTEAEVYERLGAVLEEQGDWGGAREVYEASLARDPQRVVARVKLAVVLHELQRPAEAAAALAVARATLPSSPESLADLETYTALAAALRRLGRPEDSVAVLQQAIARNPYLANAAHCDLVAEVLRAASIEARVVRRQYRSARCELGFNLVNDGGGPLLDELVARMALADEAAEQRSRAVEVYRAVGLPNLASPQTLFEPETPGARRDEAAAIAYRNLGVSLLNRGVLTGEVVWIEAAIASFRAGLEQRSRDPWLLLDASVAQLTLGRWEAAIAFAQGALAQPNQAALPTTPTSSHAWAHSILGYTWRLKGFPREALAAYHQAVRLDPEFEPALQGLRAMQE